VRGTELLKGSLDLAVVAALADGESYGYEVWQRLAAAGLSSVGDASVYGVLKRLEVGGLLQARLVESRGGPARRYYRLTRTGRTWFREASREWQAFASVIDRLIAGAGT
jgi:PadR family transcriptional regulator PadR